MYPYQHSAKITLTFNLIGHAIVEQIMWTKQSKYRVINIPSAFLLYIKGKKNFLETRIN